MMFHGEQLAMVQIGAMMSQFYPDGNVPESLSEVITVARDNLGVTITKGEDILQVRDKISEALSQHKASQVMEFK